MKKELPFILILLLLISLFFSPLIFGGKTFITTGLIQSDLMCQNYPLKFAYGRSIKEGRLLFWTSLIGNGYPVFAEGQTGELYPLNFLFFRFLPNLQAYNLSLLIHYFLAGFFTYVFCRKILKLKQFCGIFTALSFALSGFFMTHLVHPAMIQVASYIPLNLLLVEKILKTQQKTKNKKNAQYLLLLAVVFTLQVLAGHHEILYFITIFLFFYVLIRILQLERKNFFYHLVSVICHLLVAGLFTFGLSAIQILPTLELVKFSTRKGGFSFQEATAYLFPLSHLKTFVSPKSFKFSHTVNYSLRSPDAVNLWETYGYLGIIPLVFASFSTASLLSRFFQKRKGKEELGGWIITFLSLLLLTLALSLGRSTPLFRALWQTAPGIKFFRYPTRFLVFVEFSLAVLGGIGMEIFSHYLHPLTSYLLLLCTFFDLFLNNRINPSIDPKDWFVSPKTALFLKEKLQGDRFYALRTTAFDYSLIEDLEAQKDLKNLLPANFNLLFLLPQTDVLAGLFLSSHNDLNYKMPQTMLNFDKKRTILIPPQNWLKIISLQGAKYLLSPVPFFHPKLKLVKTIPLQKTLYYNIFLLTKKGEERRKIPVDQIYIYRNLTSLPRAFVVFRANLLKEKKEIFKKILTIDPKREVILEGEEEKILWFAPAKAEVKIQSDRGEKLEIWAELEKPGFLVLLDNFYPHWRAFIDGQETKIFRANYSFRAILLPPGRHKVEFVYQPLSFMIGKLITLGTGGGIVFFLFLGKKIRLRFKVLVPN